MGSITQDPATGVGELDLGGTQLVTEIDIGVTTLSSIYRGSGAGNFKRIYQIGRIGIGFILTGPIYYVAFDYFVLHSIDLVFPNAGNGVNGNTLFWDLDPGAELRIGVYWP